MSQESGPWIGASGFEHLFHVYGRDEAIPSRLGLFIYSRKDLQGNWAPIYMGQGDLSVCCEDPDLLACIDAKGATHVHMRLCSSAADRAAELADLLARYRNAFAPHGCNVPTADAGSAADALADGSTPTATA